MRTQTQKPNKNYTVTVKEAIFTRADEDVKDSSVRLRVLCTDGISRWLWFPIRHIHHGKDNRMTCPQWLVDQKNKYLRGMKLAVAQIQLENNHDQ